LSGMEEQLSLEQNELAAKLSDMERLYSLSTLLLEQDGLTSVLDVVIKTTIELLDADRGTVQLYDENRGILRIVASVGFDRGFLDHFKTVEAADNSVCALALKLGQRVVAEDLATHPNFTELAPVADRFGFRAVQSTPLRGSNGRIVGVLSTHWSQPHRPSERELRLLDLYAQHAARHIELKLAEEALLEADRRKDQFLAMLSHELRNPLTPITSALHLLRIELDDPALQRELMGLLDRQVGTLTRLVDDLLDVSRVTAGRIQLRQAHIELNALVQSTADSFRPQMESRQHQFLVALAEHPLWVKGDATRLEQVVVNLLANAAKFSPNGSQVWLTTEEERGESIVRVRDSGMGIEPDMLPKVFELFSQGERELDQSQHGLGIGLALVKSLVEMHGGTVTAASEGLGRGSEFMVRLPTAPTPLLESALVRNEPAEAAVPLRVLVVEDDEDSRRTLGRLLSVLGHQVRTAHNGPSAMAAALELQPEVVLLDLGLPGMDGYEVARRIRREPSLQGTVLVAFTGYGQQADRERSQQAGIDHHLVKPLDLDALQQLITAIGRLEWHDTP
jgi:signal transduction histidine kinase/ActR/RegA family two-component response regulator